MSIPASFSIEEGIHALTSIQTIKFGVVSAYCLAVYEWLDTLSTEIELIHASRWNSIKVAYFLCRYYLLFLWPFVLYSYVGTHTAETCAKITLPSSVVLLPMQVFGQGVFVFRSYVFTGRKFPIFCILCICYAFFIGIHVWFFCIQVRPIQAGAFDSLGKIGCFPDYTAAIGPKLAIALTSALVMDSVSLSVIVIYCLRHRNAWGPLSRTFVTQGFFALLVMIAVQIGALCAYFFTAATRQNGFGLPFILVVSNCMACRVILGLRRHALPTDTEIVRRNSLLINNAVASTVGCANNDLYDERPSESHT
ncbi:hypothetical protein C8J57DRAFT_90460 [Mycena rebaudengoi]|nr:hypothetical protein C8J57DRAFT_90460 [Mycena rebaudengoi]